MKKSILALLLIASLAVTLFACGQAPASSQSTAASVPDVSASGSVVPVVQQPVASAVEPEESAVVHGTVLWASDNGLTVKTTDGQELFFPTVDADIATVTAPEEGDWVTVEYRGTINGTDTTGVHVDRISDDSPELPAAAEGIVMEDCDETLYVTHAVHVRDTNSTDGKILTTLAKGTQVHSTGKGVHGWRRVDYNGATAYIFGDYLTEQKPAQQLAAQTTSGDTLTPTNDTVYPTVRLRMRANPSLDAKKVGVVNPGTALVRLGTFSNGWSKVEYNGTTAYCDTEYLSTTAPANVVDNDATPAGEVHRAASNTTFYTTVALKLHKTYSMDSSVVTVVPKGTALHTLNLMDNHWAEVEYDGKTVYCVTQYLAEQQPTTTQNAPTAEGFNATNDVVFPITKLHMRAQPSLGGQLITTLDAGLELERTGVSADGSWSRVVHDGQTVYCATQYLTTKRPSQMNAGTPNMTEVDETVTTTANLRLHDADALEAPVVAVAPQGTQLQRVSVLDNGWSVVFYNGERLFCSSEYLK